MDGSVVSYDRFDDTSMLGRVSGRIGDDDPDDQVHDILMIRFIVVAWQTKLLFSNVIGIVIKHLPNTTLYYSFTETFRFRFADLLVDFLRQENRLA